MKKKFISKRFAIASDGSAYPLKEKVKAFFLKEGYEVVDVGTVDPKNALPYYEAGKALAKAVAGGDFEYGIGFCGSGMGINLALNKCPGIYAALCESIYTAKLSRVINNANVLVMGGNIVSEHIAIEMAKTFIATEFLEGSDEEEFLTSAVKELDSWQIGWKIKD